MKIVPNVMTIKLAWIHSRNLAECYVNLFVKGKNNYYKILILIFQLMVLNKYSYFLKIF